MNLKYVFLSPKHPDQTSWIRGWVTASDYGWIILNLCLYLCRIHKNSLKSVYESFITKHNFTGFTYTPKTSTRSMNWNQTCFYHLISECRLLGSVILAAFNYTCFKRLLQFRRRGFLRMWVSIQQILTLITSYIKKDALSLHDLNVSSGCT